MSLQIKNISFCYESVDVLTDVSFVAKEGEILGIIGPNGSGKTTLLKCINSVLKPKSGTILIGETEISRLNRGQIAKLIAVVPQNSITFPFQVFDIVLMGRYPHISGLGSENLNDYQIVLDAMCLTGVDQFSERYIDELSGGELQKVIIARALAQEARILLLDEPTTHLDINHQLEILELIKKITKKKALTTILVSHNINLAARFCDTLLLLDTGKVHSIGTVSDVLTAKNLQDVFHVRAEISYQKEIQSYQATLIQPINKENQFLTANNEP